MSGSSKSCVATEIEVKFLGGEAEYQRVIEWLGNRAAVGVESRKIVHRVHVYFDANSILQEEGSRLRCVIAPGEWCRYDFKAPHGKRGSGGSDSLEISIKKRMPVSIEDAISEISGLLEDDRHRERLSKVRESPQLVAVMTGDHHKTVVRSDNLKIEISWDTLIPLRSGVRHSEVEIELLSGDQNEFGRLIEAMEKALTLTRSHLTKIDWALKHG